MQCHICKREMHDGPPYDDRVNCGGDCVRCMAECGDPDCIEAMHALELDNPQWFPEDV